MTSIQQGKKSTVDTVCDALEKDILSMHFAPGAKITESDLSLRYGISRNTIREGIAHLLAQGLLTKVANTGVFVRRFTVEDVQEIFHLRQLLEAEAVRAICASGKNVHELYLLTEELEQIDRLTQWDTYVQKDIQFHKALVGQADSPRLSRLYETISAEVKLCIYQTRHYVSLPTEPNHTHRALVDAISCGNSGNAQLLVLQHIQHVVKRYCAGLLAMNNATE
jgi:DNA-binding GntR family transcriptional regulator